VREDCKCVGIAEYLDELKLMREIMEREFKRTSNSRRVDNGAELSENGETRPLTNRSNQN